MAYEYDHDCPFEAFITNLGKYNEGELVGEWVKFPTTSEELQKVFERIGIGSKDEFGNPYEEWFISDYDCYVSGLYDKLGEYYYEVTVTNGKGETTAETKKIGRSNLEIRYSADVSTTFDNASKLDASNPIKIEFDRSSGAEKTDIGKIWVKHGSTEKTITIYKETGKIECN